MATVAQLDVSIGVEDKFSQGLSSASSKFSSFGADLTRLGAGLTASLTLPLLGIGASIIKIGSEFDDAFDSIAIATGATGDALKALEQNFRNVVANVPASFAAASEAMGTLAARTGLTGQALEELTKVELELARMTKGELAGQIVSTTRLFADWSVATDQQTATLDKLFRAFQAGGGSVQSLTEKLVQFGAPLRTMGFDLDQSIALLAKFQKEGVNMEVVLTSLRISLKRMSDAGITDSAQALKILIQRIKDAATDSKATAIAFEVFGAKAGVDMARAIREGRFAIDDMLKSIKDGKSTIMGTAESTKDFGERFIELRNKVTLALEPLGERFFAAVNNLVPVIVNLVGKLATLVEWFTKLPQPIQTFIIALGGIAVAAGPAMIAVGQLGGAITSLINISGSAIPALAKFSGALGGLGAMAGLVGVAVGGAFIAAEMQWSAAQKRFIASTNQMKTEVNRFGQEIKKLGDADIKAAIQTPGKLINGMVVDLKTGLVEGTKVVKTGATAMGAGIPKGFGDGLKSGGGGGGAKAALDPFIEEVKQAMKAINQAIKDGLLGGDEIGRVLADKITPAVDVLKKKAAELATTIRAVGDAFNREMGTAIDSVTEKVIRGDGSFEALINRMILFKRASEEAARASKEEFNALSDTFKDLSSNLPRAWNTIIDSILQGSGRLGTDLLKLGVKVKGYATDIINVFDTMPGKWGQSLNKALNEINRWISFLDSAVKLVQRMMGDEVNGLTGILTSVFKKTSKAVTEAVQETKDASQDWSATLEKMGSSANAAGTSVTKGVGRILGGLAGLAGGVMAIAGIKGGGAGMGAVTGALGAVAAVGGIAALFNSTMAAMFTGPAAPFVFAGIAAGAIIGALFGRKTALQKAQEAAALQQAKDAIKLSLQSVLKGAQEVIQSATQSFMLALEFFQGLDEFTAIRKEKFKAFWKAMTQLLDGFFQLAKQFVGQSMPELKAVAETIAPIAQAIAQLPLAFDAINSHFGVAQSSIDQFFNDFDRIITGFFNKVEAWAVGRAKHARKIATNIAPAIDLLGPLLEAIKNMSSISRPPDEAFDIIESVLETIVMRTAALSEKFDKALLKTMANFAEKSGGALSLFSEAVGSLKAMTELKMPTEQDFANVFTGIEKVINGMIDVASRLTTDGLGRAEGMAQASLTLFASLKAGVEALSALKDFAGVLPEVFDKFFDDFNHAIDLVESMATRGIAFDNASKNFKDYISSGTAHLTTAFQMLSQIMNAAGSFFPSGAPAAASVPALATGGDIQSSGLAYLHAGERVVPASVVNQGGTGAAGTTNITVNFYGTVLDEAKAQEFVYQAVRKHQRRGRLIMAPSV